MAITGQDLKVLELAAMGYTDSRISFELGIGRDNLATTWRRLLPKIGASNRKEALAKYAERTRPSGAPSLEELEASLLAAVSDQIGSEAKERAQQRLLRAITEASLCYINGRQNVRHVFSRMLDDLLAITESEYGIVGEVLYDAGIPFIGEHALTSISWDDVTQARYDIGHKDHLLFRNVDALFGETIKGREPTIVANHAQNSNVGFPHPPIQTFLGIPVLNGMELVGVIGLANRAAGYSKEIAEFLKPIVSTCANVTVAWRLEARSRAMEKQLAESNCMMRTLVDRTPTAVLYENADRRLEFVNDRFAQLFAIEAAPAQLVGLDASLVVKHSARLFSDPSAFFDRVEDLITGQESFYGELIEMTDGRLFLRDFVVVRSASAVCGFFWHYREVMTPLDP